MGQAPSSTSEGRGAFDGDSGRRLARAAEVPILSDAFDAVNLLQWWPGKAPGGKGDRFPLQHAREAATRELLGAHRVVLLAGRGVAAAFGVWERDYLEWFVLHGRQAAVIPHPSGTSHWWNQEHNRVAARLFLRQAVARARGGAR